MTHASSSRLHTALVGIVLAGMLLLAACGGSSSSSDNASGPVTLTFGWWSNGPQHDQQFADWAQTYTKTHPNVTIKTEFLPFGDYFTKLKTSAAAGDAYDLIGQCSCVVAPYYANGQMADLSQFADFQSAVAGLDSGAVQTTTFSGHPYAMPLGVAARVIGYNKAMFAAANIPTPDPVKPLTLTQFVALTKQLTIAQNGKITQAGLVTGLDFDTSYLPEFFAENNGASFFDSYVNPKHVTINTPQGIAALTTFQSLWTQNIEPSPDDTSWTSGLAALQSNKVAMTISGPWEFSQFDTSKYGVMPIPVTDAGQHMQRMTINALSIFAGSKHKAAAWEFLKWAAETPQQVSFSTFSDTPVNKSAFSQFNTVIQPKDFYPTLQVEATNIRPYLLTPSTELSSVTTKALQDLVRGKLTPTQAAAQLQQQGDAALANS